MKGESVPGGEDEPERLERLARYVTRAPFAVDRALVGDRVNEVAALRPLSEDVLAGRHEGLEDIAD